MSYRSDSVPNLLALLLASVLFLVVRAILRYRGKLEQLDVWRSGLTAGDKCFVVSKDNREYYPGHIVRIDREKGKGGEALAMWNFDSTESTFQAWVPLFRLYPNDPLDLHPNAPDHRRKQ